MRMGLFVICCFLACTGVSVAQMGTFDPDAKQWEVRGDHLSCTFFQGCMYPVWFRNAQGNEFPFFIFTDQLSAEGKTFKLHEERWAEFNVIENSNDRFIIGCRGVFCDGLPPHNTACKNVEALYRYTLRRDSATVKVEIHLSKKELVAYSVSLMWLRWRFRPFRIFATESGNIDLDAVLSKPGSRKYGAGRLLFPVMNFSIPAESVTLA